MKPNGDARPVIVAFDGSPEAIEAVRTAATLFSERRVLVVTVWEPGLGLTMSTTTELGGASYIPPDPAAVEALDRAQEDHAQSTAEAGVRLASEHGAAAEALPVPDSANVAGTIVDIAEQRDAAALVVGSRGLGRVKSALMGSTSRQLLHETRRPLVIVRAPE